MLRNKLTILFFLLTGLLWAQSSISFDFDYARYKYDIKSSYLELHYSIGQSNLQKQIVNDRNIVSAILQVRILDADNGKIVIEKKYQANSEVDDTNGSVDNKNLIGVIGYVLEKGEYELDISAYDFFDSSNCKKFKETIKISLVPENTLGMSDIQLATRIINDSKNTNSIFYKNTMEVIPNPINVFGQNIPVMFYYTELYNLTSDTTGVNDLVLTKSLINSIDVQVYSKKKNIKRNNDSIVEVGLINVSQYPTGSYRLVMSIIDSKTNHGISTSKRLFIINPDVVDTFKNVVGDDQVISSEFGVYSEEECDEMFEYIKYVATSQEIDQYEVLSGEEVKREFLFEFWKKRDPDLTTRTNEAKEEYMRRVEYVERKYRTFTKSGYKTDRGRVYLLYGEPDEIDMHPNDYDKKPYEIWFYQSIEGGVQFIFGDITGYSDYELLHSDKRGELRDDNWTRRILAN